MALLLACTAATGACRHAVMVADAGPKPPVSEGTISGLLQTPGNGAAVVGRKVTVINNANGQRYEVKHQQHGRLHCEGAGRQLPDRSRAAAGRSRDRRANRSACGRERHRCPHRHHRGTGLTNAVDSSGSACRCAAVSGCRGVPEFRVHGCRVPSVRYEPGTRNRRTWNAERTRNPEPNLAAGTRNPELQTDPSVSTHPTAADVHPAGTTSSGRIISLSSCSTMWQCQTKRPGISNRALIVVTSPGSAHRVLRPAFPWFGRSRDAFRVGALLRPRTSPRECGSGERRR